MKKFDAYKKDEPGNNGLNNASILTFSKDVVNASKTNNNLKKVLEVVLGIKD
jgi:hypothetical protein